MSELFEKLLQNGSSDMYPYHMPGHKRRLTGQTLLDVKHLDITEIDGFDNLHEAEGILLHMEQKTAAVYGADRCYYLVNGSTCGILAALSAAVPEGSRVLMTRGAHKAAYHALYLRHLEPEYLYPDTIPGFGCLGPVSAKAVDEALTRHPDIRAVFIVSPTYEGIVSPVREIADVAHAHGAVLIVDEAHGAHLGFHPGWPANACTEGADLVIASLHKTLCAPTQTAILLANGDRVERRSLERFLSIYQTSSPSYLFMAAMEEAVELAADKQAGYFDLFLKNWQALLKELKSLKHIEVLCCTDRDDAGSNIFDPGKLVVRDASGIFSGQQIYDYLRDIHHMQLEMASPRYALLMFTLADGEEGYLRAAKALRKLDMEIHERLAEAVERQLISEIGGVSAESYPAPEIQLSLSKAWDAPWEECSAEKAKGRISAEFVNLYPPGIPVLAPGETVTEQAVMFLNDSMTAGLRLNGVTLRGNELYLKVLKEK